MSAYDEISQPYVATIETEGKRYTVSVRITYDGIEYVGRLWFADESWDDLGLPDYDGHRSNEKARIEEAKVLDGYKQTATKKFLEWLVVGAVAIFGAGVVEWVKTHIK